MSDFPTFLPAGFEEGFPVAPPDDDQSHDTSLARDAYTIAIQVQAALNAHVVECAKSWERLNRNGDERHAANSERLDRLEKSTSDRLDKIEENGAERFGRIEGMLGRAILGVLTILISAIGGLLWMLAHKLGLS